MGINAFVKKGVLKPLKAGEKNTVFLKSDVMKRNWR